MHLPLNGGAPMTEGGNTESPMKLIFTMSAGRTGTGYLAELLRCNLPSGALVAHEQVDWRAFGTRSPDLSHQLQFNHEGFSPYVAAFWEQKLGQIYSFGRDVYAETSHVLMKAGLVEALRRYATDHEVHLVWLRRDHLPTLTSYHRRGDFTNLGNRYMWYLDPTYVRNLVKPDPFLQFGVFGQRLWYLLEVEARASYYRALLDDDPRITVHEARLEAIAEAPGATALLEALGVEARGGKGLELPSRVNENVGGIQVTPAESAQMARMVQRVSSFDADALVRPLVERDVDPFCYVPAPPLVAAG